MCGHAVSALLLAIPTWSDDGAGSGLETVAVGIAFLAAGWGLRWVLFKRR